MLSNENKVKIQQQYDALLAACEGSDLPDYFKKMTERFQKGGWYDWLGVICRQDFDFQGKTVVDFGCKWGHTMLIFRGLGATRVIGVDAYSEYVKRARQIIVSRDPHIDMLESSDGLLEIQSESVDFVFMCEVISHINPQFLPVVWSEISRILKPGGRLLISDGNNLDLPKTKEDLLELYTKWEIGPTGVTTCRDTVTRSFLSWREDVIREHFPKLSDEKVQYYARATSGFFGEKLLELVQNAIDGKPFTERKYQCGICPTNPTYGVVMERGFYPVQLILELEPYLLQVRQWQGDAANASRRTLKQRLGWFLVDCCERLARTLRATIADPKSNLTLIGDKIKVSPQQDNHNEPAFTE